jgi:hypothetical protein
MYTREQIEQHIWDYIDGLSTPAEKQMVEQLLQTDQQWMVVYNELKGFNEMIGSADIIEQPSLRFTKNVMEEVAKYKVAPPASSYINKNIIIGIAAFFILSIIGFLVYGISFIDLSAQGTIKLPGTGVDQWNIDWSKYLNSTVINVFLLMDVIAGLLLLDRYLRRKKETKVQA